MQHRHLELARPLLRLGVDSTGDAGARLRCHAAIGLTRRAESQSVRRDAIDDDLLLGERHDVDIGNDLIRLHQILERVVWARDREPVHPDLPVGEIEMQILNLDPGAEHLRADFLRLVKRDAVGKDPPEDGNDHEQHEQWPDRLPAEDFDAPPARAHGRNIR